jgi:hypothetical protein
MPDVLTRLTTNRTNFHEGDQFAGGDFFSMRTRCSDAALAEYSQWHANGLKLPMGVFSCARVLFRSALAGYSQWHTNGDETADRDFFLCGHFSPMWERCSA